MPAWRVDVGLPQLRGPGGPLYVGELVPGECITIALAIDDGMSVPWALDPRCVQDELLGLLEGGGVPVVEQLVE